LRFIPTKIHAVADYVVGLVLVMPFVYGMSGVARFVLIARGAAAILYCLVTNLNWASCLDFPLPWPAPLLLAIPGRPQLLLFDPRDVARVLTGSPHPFRMDTKEKRAAHFEPGNVLIADPNRRAALRPLHETALATSTAVHPWYPAFARSFETSTAASCGPTDVDRMGHVCGGVGFAWCAASSGFS
jgi:hypothetical protein